jgi:hypothetical protein
MLIESWPVDRPNPYQKTRKWSKSVVETVATCPKLGALHMPSNRKSGPPILP